MYEDTSPRNGKRVLVDRLWPRGMSKERAHLDEWLRDVARSADLRPRTRHPHGVRDLRRAAARVDTGGGEDVADEVAVGPRVLVVEDDVGAVDHAGPSFR
ncbi:DUF488 domain-containing protein [Streptomyces sp. NBC_01446]|uniref:DUF488 domain-containing protein n=1 Tax=Streptomyces sp. NBC_01446 TaxID=2903870 RepID=UPI0022591ADB|nr:DUF488 family protein [Streptomyces sp. NBC_01446]MCX4641651.1 DUF488 family protein [Streptomyces sp. NBC_01446]